MCWQDCYSLVFYSHHIFHWKPPLAISVPYQMGLSDDRGSGSCSCFLTGSVHHHGRETSIQTSGGQLGIWVQFPERWLSQPGGLSVKCGEMHITGCLPVRYLGKKPHFEGCLSWWEEASVKAEPLRKQSQGFWSHLDRIINQLLGSLGLGWKVTTSTIVQFEALRGC